MRRVGVVGAAGKMGAAAVAAIAAAEGLELAALVTRSGGSLAPLGAPSVAGIEALDASLVDVVVDLTVAEAAVATIRWAIANGVDALIGTSGISDAELAGLSSTGGARILVVPNFSIGAVLLGRFAAVAARYFDGVEVIELHHDQKPDAPSGTSVATAKAVAAARAASERGDVAEPTRTETIPGARGALGPGGVRVHSVRLPGLLAHQEVHFGSPGEGLVLRHDSYDRASFMHGLVLALQRIDRVDGLQVGLEAVLEA